MVVRAAKACGPSGQTARECGMAGVKLGAGRGARDPSAMRGHSSVTCRQWTGCGCRQICGRAWGSRRGKGRDKLPVPSAHRGPGTWRSSGQRDGQPQGGRALSWGRCAESQFSGTSERILSICSRDAQRGRATRPESHSRTQVRSQGSRLPAHPTSCCLRGRGTLSHLAPLSTEAPGADGGPWEG